MRYPLWGALLLVWLAAPIARAQSDVPVISGGAGFLSSTQGGSTSFQPVVAPVIAIPLGDRWLLESRADLRGVFYQPNSNAGYNGQFFDTLEYAQVDYNAASWLTIVAGRFLTPFNMYNERFSAIWIHDLQDPPIIVPIGTRTTGYSDGLMARGVLASSNFYQVHYTTYFSTLSTMNKLESARAAGGVVGVFFPAEGLEVGTSYQKLLQDVRENSVGAYLSWQPPSTPLDVRAEYAHSALGRGYWLEGAYRFSPMRGSESLLGRLQAVGRVQQFVRGVPDSTGALPPADTQRVDFGWNYYLPHEVRLNASYGRQFSPLGNANVWDLGVTYRFLFPLYPGKKDGQQ